VLSGCGGVHRSLEEGIKKEPPGALWGGTKKRPQERVLRGVCCCGISGSWSHTRGDCTAILLSVKIEARIAGSCPEMYGQRVQRVGRVLPEGVYRDQQTAPTTGRMGQWGSLGPRRAERPEIRYIRTKIDSAHVLRRSLPPHHGEEKRIGGRYDFHQCAGGHFTFGGRVMTKSAHNSTQAFRSLSLSIPGVSTYT
jgi:hypothetical protein